MQLKIKTLKFLRKTSFTILLSLVIIYQSFSQEVVTIDSTGVARNTELTSNEKDNDSVKFSDECTLLHFNSSAYQK